MEWYLKALIKQNTKHVWSMEDVFDEADLDAWIETLKSQRELYILL